MSIDFENQLREAFGELSDSTPDVAATTDRAIARANGLRRRRAVLLGSTMTAGAAAVVAAALVGAGLRTGASSGHLMPAAEPTASMAPRTDITSTPAAVKSEMSKQLAKEKALNKRSMQSKRIDGVGGYLLPHGSQLNGLRYINNMEQGVFYTTSPQNAMPDAAFLAEGIGSNVPGADQSAPDNFGRVATAWDTAFNHTSSGKMYADGNHRQRALVSNVTRFKSSDYAATAIAKAQAKTGPIIWYLPDTTPLSWSGVPGEQGEHYLYDMGKFADGQKHDLAIQVVGPFIVSAESADPSMSTQAVTAMVANLHSAKLVK